MTDSLCPSLPVSFPLLSFCLLLFASESELPVLFTHLYTNPLIFVRKLRPEKNDDRNRKRSCPTSLLTINERQCVFLFHLLTHVLHVLDFSFCHFDCQDITFFVCCIHFFPQAVVIHHPLVSCQHL